MQKTSAYLARLRRKIGLRLALASAAVSIKVILEAGSMRKRKTMAQGINTQTHFTLLAEKKILFHAFSIRVLSSFSPYISFSLS